MKFRPKANNTLGLVNAENQTGAPNRKVKKQPKEKAAVLQFTLRHGDIVIMHGPKIQKLYEVSLIFFMMFEGTCILTPSSMPLLLGASAMR